VHCLFQKSAVLAIKLAWHAASALIIDALGGVDNVALDFTLAALKSRRICFWFYETHLPAIQANAQTSAWFSCPDENKRGPRNAGTPQATRPQTLAPKGRREALRAPYTGLAHLFLTIWSSSVYPIEIEHVFWLVTAPLTSLLCATKI
jgi:hypothetical protein